MGLSFFTYINFVINLPDQYYHNHIYVLGYLILGLDLDLLQFPYAILIKAPTY